jgi:LysM repeat protein
VKQGDTLYKIAAKFDITVKELVDKNGIENPDYIYPGMKLVVG